MSEEPKQAVNIAAGKVEYKIVETKLGTWKIYVYPTGLGYREFTSKAAIAGWPLLHLTLGKCPETGASKPAVGVVAIGRKALGFLAIGQFAFGVLTLAQFGIGFLFLAQFGIGWSGLGQVAVAYQFAVGQVAIAQSAVGQFALGRYALGQIAFGKHVWDTRIRDPEAVQYFMGLLNWLKTAVGVH